MAKRRGNRTRLSSGEIADSGTEATFFEILTRNSIPFQYQVTHLLSPMVPKTKKKELLRDACITKMEVTTDFELSYKGCRLIIDTKGSKATVTEGSRLRYRLLKYKLYLAGENAAIVFVYAEELKKLGFMKKQGILDFLYEKKRL